MKQSETGFTLVEVMITVAVVALALLGLGGASILIQQKSVGLFERSVAIQDTNQVLERMRQIVNDPCTCCGTTACTGVGTCTSFPSCLTAQYPNNGTVAGFSNLTSESVAVSYVSSTANPLDATVTTTWTERGVRTNSREAIRTYITKRN